MFRLFTLLTLLSASLLLFLLCLWNAPGFGRHPMEKFWNSLSNKTKQKQNNPTNKQTKRRSSSWRAQAVLSASQ